MFDRLIGLETEYAIRFHPSKAGGRRIRNSELFARLVRQIREKVPLAPAIVLDYGWFLGNGGALRFEKNPFLAFFPLAGVVEGSTPECRGPRQLLQYQRAQDVLLSRAAVSTGAADGDFTLLKNNRDSQGTCYGSHENYEATIASGKGLFFWRLGLAILFPVIVLASFVALAALAAVLIAALMLLSPFAVLRLFSKRVTFPAIILESLVNGFAYLALLPIMLLLQAFVCLTAFRQQRRRLLAFLVSRTIISGAGMVDANGKFSLSPRARAVSGVCSTLAECRRGIFHFHVLKGMFAFLAGDRRSYTGLFGRRQRLHLMVGDSNMTQNAEYLKIGTTLLVLEAIEAGALEDAPRLRRPLSALRTINADPGLKATVPLAGGKRRTALEIQRYYLAGCRRFLKSAGGSHAEAQDVLTLWEETLDALESDPCMLVGKLDWVTKRYLLGTAGANGSIAEKRKIDLRYHELSRDGYYMRLEAAGIAPTVVEPEDVLDAINVPPGGTPATTRSRLIHEYAGEKQALRVSWYTAVVGMGPRSLRIRLQ
jgi:proteasome accessory factor A